MRRASALNRVEDLEYFWVFLGICSLPEVFIYGLLDVQEGVRSFQYCLVLAVPSLFALFFFSKKGIYLYHF